MTVLSTKTEFQAFVEKTESDPDYQRPLAFGIGIAQLKHGRYLDTYYPFPNYEQNYGTAAVLASVVGYKRGTSSCHLDYGALRTALEYFAWIDENDKTHANVEVLRRLRDLVVADRRRCVVVSFIGGGDTDDGPQGVPDIYLRLHLMSHRFVLPWSLKVTAGIMALLPNVAWTSEGAMLPEEVAEAQLSARLRAQTLRVYGVDKLPHMLDYVVPPGVRVADTARVRLGAYLGDGTTVMPSGFVNFNAGTRGKAMIEGRVSQGVIVGDGSDVGGAGSIQGTMSGGSKVVVEIGERTLIGALAGTGISLGDDCIVAAGVYVMPKSDVMLVDAKGVFVRVAKGHELSGQNGLLFVRAHDGTLEARANTKAVELNPMLHAN